MRILFKQFEQIVVLLFRPRQMIFKLRIQMILPAEWGQLYRSLHCLLLRGADINDLPSCSYKALILNC